MFGSKCVVSNMNEIGEFIYRDLKFSWRCCRLFSSSGTPRHIVEHVVARYWNERGLQPSSSRMKYFCTLTVKIMTLRLFEYDDTVPLPGRPESLERIWLCYCLCSDGCKVFMILTKFLLCLEYKKVTLNHWKWATLRCGNPCEHTQEDKNLFIYLLRIISINYKEM